MYKNKLIWILSSATIVLLVAVAFVHFFRIDTKNESTAFMPVNNKAEVEEFKSKSLSDLTKAQVDDIGDDFAEGFNRSVESLPESLELKINEISGIPGKIEIQEKTVKQSVETIEVPFETIEYYTDRLAAGVSEVTVQGVNGTVNIVYEETYYGDVLNDKVEIGREVVANAINQEIAIGQEPVVQVTEAPAVKTEVAHTEEIPAVDNTQAIQTPQPEYVPEAPAEPVAPPAEQNIQFVTPGSPSAAATNLSKISSLMKANGIASYYDFSDNGNGTITVDGYTFAYTSTSYNTITGYDGIECSPNGIPNNTAAGLSTTRGIVATVFPQFGGYPFGTVLFIEGYGLVVVGDYNGMGGYDSSWLDVCYYDGEIAASGIDPGRSTSKVYVIATN